MTTYNAVPMTVVRVGIDLKLFEILAEKKGAPMSVSELADETGAEYLLISASTGNYSSTPVSIYRIRNLMTLH